MRRAVVIRVLSLFLAAALGFWFGTQTCSSFNDRLTPEKNQSPKETDVGEIRRMQTAKFNRGARKNALETKCCKKILPLQALPNSVKHNLLRHIIVDRKNKLLYCYVPKVASSNMKRLLLTLQGKSDSADAIKYFDARGFEFLSDFNATERDRIVKMYYKFLFVRDPLLRLVSAYKNKFVTPNAQFHIKYGRTIVKKYRKNSSLPIRGDDVTFREFVLYLIDQETDEMNEHWMPIFNLCQPCYIPYDFLGSLEFLTFDVSVLLDKINVSKRISFPKKQAYYNAELTRKNTKEFFGNITADEYRSLYTKYKNDFNCFSYPSLNKVRHVAMT